MKKQIEIEYRARFNKTKFEKIKKSLSRIARDLGKDDKDVYFFIFSDKLLKVTNNISKKTAKITLKLNKIGKGSDFEEIEIPINQKDINGAVKLFSQIGSHESVIRSYQQRHNYLYKGVEIALKYSKNWGYHLELEVVIINKKKRQAAERLIFTVAKELDVKLMTEEELVSFVEKIEIKYRK
jgi:adenylate cyclase class IV